MRKNVLLVAGLVVVSTSAFASKSRMIALGQGSESRFIGDSRSVFVNPAEVNNYKNYVVTEWGTSSNTTDTDTAPRAEGGFFREMGSFAYGIYLGNNESRIAPVGVTTTRVFDTQTNAMDLFFGGDMGMKWGARLHYAASKDESATTTNSTTFITQKTNAIGLALGAIHGDFDFSINADLADKSTGASGTAGLAADESKLKPSFTVDAGYNWMGNKFYASFNSDKREEKLTATTNYKQSEIRVGWGRTHDVSPTAKVFMDAYASVGSDENITAAGKTKYQRLPLTIGMETDATSWLALRGSVSQNVIIGQTKNTAGKKVTDANSTTVNGGATLTFGKLKVDGVVGTTSSTGTAGSKTGTLQTSNLLTRVGLTYNF